jgi:peroxiredoxin
VKIGTLAQIAFIAIAALAVYTFVHAAQNDQRRMTCSAICSLAPAYAGRDRIAPDFDLPDMTGQRVRLSQYRGKTVILNFWTRTCRPCLEEMPGLAELAKIAKTEKDIVVLSVSTDDGPSAVADTLQVVLKGEMPFPVLFDPDAKVIGDAYGTHLFPETWIIDPSGIIRARFDGARDWSDPLTLEIAKMIARPSGCPVEFAKGLPHGKFAGICGDDS